MKTLRLLAACALLGFMALPMALAGVDCPWDAATPLVWRTSTVTGDPSDQGFIDSAVVRGDGSTVASAQRLDTTAAIPLWDKYITGNPEADQFGATDSIVVFFLQINPSKSAAFTAGGDSIKVVLQVSNDGSNWTSCNATQYSVLDPGTSLQFNRMFCTNLAGAAVPDEDSFFGWGLGRFIIQSDLNGEYTGNVRYRKCKNPQ